MELGLFQLENLFLNPNLFLFFDLRSETERSSQVEAAVQRLLARAEPVDTKEVAFVIQKRGVALDFPVVLLCANGLRSLQVAAELERAGHGNVYVVAGGVTGLLSEI